MTEFAHCLSLVLAALALQVPLTRIAAQASDAPVPTLPMPARDNSSPLDLRLDRPLSRSEELALVPLDRFRECEHCPAMIVVPGGSFTMGASADESGSTADERPQHQVAIRKFAVGRFPVSRDEWNACVIEKGCSFRPFDTTGDRRLEPVTNIQWPEAKEYVEWLSRVTGRPYRMLSEAEREYVARAGTTTAFWWGNTFPIHRGAERQVAGPSAPSPTMFAFGRSLPNPWGIYEVHGRVYDWVEDCWHDTYQDAPTDGSAWTEGDCSRHVLRGGSASRAVQTRRAAARIWFGSSNRMHYMSIRVARTLQP